MRIAIFTDSFYPQVNGVVTATVSLAKGLADKGHKIYIIAPKYWSITEFRYQNIVIKRMAGVPAFFYPGFKFTNFLSPAILNFLRAEKVQLIHFQTPSTVGMQGIIAAKMLKLPLVGTFHTFITDPEYLKHAGVNIKLIEGLAWNYSKAYYNRCNLVTCPSESAKKELLNNGITHRIKVISNGIDKDIFDNRNYKTIKKAYNPHGPLILFVGRIAYEKNLPYLLDCFKIVVNKIPKAKLLMVGGGPQFNEIKHYVNKIGLDNNVIMTGEIKHDKLVKSGIFKACSIFITASKTETQGITTLESQVNGLVTVAVKAKGLQDLVKNNHNGSLVPSGNKREFAYKVIKLITDKKVYSRMKKNTLKEIRRHYLNNVIKMWEGEYRKLIASNKH